MGVGLSMQGVVYTLIQHMVELSSGRGALMQGVVCTLKQDMVELFQWALGGLYSRPLHVREFARLQ